MVDPGESCRVAAPDRDRLYVVEGEGVVRCVVIADDATGRFRDAVPAG